MEKLEQFLPIRGDDNGTFSIPYFKVPKAYGFQSLEFPTDHPLTFAVKEKLVEFAEGYYRHHEIVGYTIADFAWNLQLDLMENIDTFEKMLAVYEDDIAKPTQSRTIKRTYDLVDTSDETNTSQQTSEATSQGTSKDFELPIDNATSQEVARTETSGSNNTKNNGSTVGKGTSTKKGTEIEDWSDVGVAPNYILLNGFLDNNRTLYKEFVRYFENDFTLTEGLYGYN